MSNHYFLNLALGHHDVSPKRQKYVLNQLNQPEIERFLSSDTVQTTAYVL
jgi:hypothetical protein